MGAVQHRNVHRLVATGLSTPGYVTVALIMGLDNILDQLEGWSVDFGRARGRDPLLYYLTIFGEPGGDAPGGGASAGTAYRCTTRSSAARSWHRPRISSAPIRPTARCWGRICRPLAAAQDLGRELFGALDRAPARAGADLAGGAHGSGRQQPPEARGRQPAVADSRHLPPAVRRPARRARGRHAVGPGSDDRRQASPPRCHELQRRAEGARSWRSTPARPRSCASFLGCYLARLPEELADQQARLLDQEFDRLTFLWAGSAERGQPHYYRIQGQRVFIEYDNSQRGANHIHTVVARSGQRLRRRCARPPLCPVAPLVSCRAWAPRARGALSRPLPDLDPAVAHQDRAAADAHRLDLAAALDRRCLEQARAAHLDPLHDAPGEAPVGLGAQAASSPASARLALPVAGSSATPCSGAYMRARRSTPMRRRRAYTGACPRRRRSASARHAHRAGRAPRRAPPGRAARPAGTAAPPRRPAAGACSRPPHPSRGRCSPPPPRPPAPRPASGAAAR